VDLARLWYHENMRVFHDRLIDETDRKLFKEILKDQIELLEIPIDELLNSERVLFGDFYESKDGDNRLYRQFDDLQYLAKKLYEY
jgi:dynein heavy chain, axonemal